VSQKNAEQHYQGRANFVIYPNVGEYGIRQTQIEGCFASATSTVASFSHKAWPKSCTTIGDISATGLTPAAVHCHLRPVAISLQ
jgi:hypothetical protein